jgi:amino acid transporter, AAT family
MTGVFLATAVGQIILAAIHIVGIIGEVSRPQLLSTWGLVALLAVTSYHCLAFLKI